VPLVGSILSRDEESSFLVCCGFPGLPSAFYGLVTGAWFSPGAPIARRSEGQLGLGDLPRAAPSLPDAAQACFFGEDFSLKPPSSSLRVGSRDFFSQGHL